LIVISDSSPLIALSAVGRLDLLRALYQRIVVPEAVLAEVAREGEDRPGAKEVLAATWIEVRRVEDTSLVNVLLSEIDRGESEAIALAASASEPDVILLIDERRGRAVATRMGIRIVGAVGIISEAKARGLIPSVREVLDSLVADPTFRLSRHLYDEVLKDAGEA
jgi:predicted nucleic acid-binding protein